MSRRVRAVQFGCGPMGCGVVRYALQRSDIELAGAIDIDSNLIGRDLGTVAGAHELGVKIEADANNVLVRTKPEIVFLMTSSFLEVAYPQICMCAAAGANVISTCEELSYPYYKNPQLAAKINDLAKGHDVTVLATGVNPGFLMDTWPLFMTGVCQEVKRIKTTRVQNASSRRGPFQKKIGAGCTLEQFNKLVASGTLRHMGLPESVAMIADGLGWTLESVTESIEPVVAKAYMKTDFVTVEPGQVAGVRQAAKGIRNGEELIILEFEAYVGAPESHDAVFITGVPNLEVVIKGGTHGDIATAAIVVNCIPRVLGASPGLLTMKDLPIVSAMGVGM